jgi:hypothetical protein
MRRTLRLARYWFSVMRRRPWLKTLFEHTFPRLFGEKKSHANKLVNTHTPHANSFVIGTAVINTHTQTCNKLTHTHVPPREQLMMMMMMSFICSCRKKKGAELHIHLQQGTYHKRLFRGPITNDMKK